jgi:hypothetical protein
VRAQLINETQCDKSLVQTKVKKSDVKAVNDGACERCFDVVRHMN